MINALIVACGLLAVSNSPTAPSDQDLKAYQEARAQAKRDPAAHVRLALWCEAHGMEAERIKHLGIAVLSDPSNATARGLLGLVAFDGGWQSPDKVSDKVRADADLAAALAEYNAKRAKTPNTADAQWQLALWCEQKGLKPEATAHLTAVVRLEPRREDAWRHLGYKKLNGHWTTEAQLAAAKADVEAQKLADHHWKPLLEKYRDWLGKKDKQVAAENALIGVTDPRAVPSIWQVFATGSAAPQKVAVQLLGQVASPAASRGVAFLAVFGKSDEVRRVAVETLTQRDAREFLDPLIAVLRNRLKYEVRPVGGPGSPGMLFVEGERYNVRRLYAAPPLPDQTQQMLAQSYSGFVAPLDRAELAFFTAPAGNQRNNVAAGQANALEPGMAASSPMAGLLLRRQVIVARNLAEAQKSAEASQQQLQSDIAEVDAYNKGVGQANEHVMLALKNVTGQDLSDDHDTWMAWWSNEQGYSYNQASTDAPKPTFEQLVPSGYTPSYARSSHSCFGAGTQVCTFEGSRPIETIRVGDRVLTQDTRTGAMSFQPVMAVYHNRPAETFRVQLGDETIVATGIHRFWKAGKGWTMARELKPGDTIRQIGGVARVASVESDAVQPVFNLEVAEGQSFFVGKHGALVHDNSLVKPALHPFDAEPELTVASSNRAAAN
jgi:hypothetical protein